MIKFEEELSVLKKRLLEMASGVEDMIAKSIKALVEKNMLMAQEVIKSDATINKWEIEIDNLSIKILGLYQPEARDLRLVTMMMKINNDLERIGDHAVSIAKMALYLSESEPVKPLVDIPRMAEKTVDMLSKSIDAFINKDSDLAIEVCRMDDLVDEIEPQVVRELMTFIMADAKIIDRALRLIYVVRHLERVADLATNIAEDAYYIDTGEVLKHHHSSEIN